MIRLLNLRKGTQILSDVVLADQSTVKFARICPQEKWLGISHGNGNIEVWYLPFLAQREEPKAYRVLKDVGNSDFYFLYSTEAPTIISLLLQKAKDFAISKQKVTRLKIYNIEKQRHDASQRLQCYGVEMQYDEKANLIFVRDRRKGLFQLDMNDMQKQNNPRSNYFNTELMRCFLHNSQLMNAARKDLLLNQFNLDTCFSWNFNLVNVAAMLGTKPHAMKTLLDFGYPFLVEGKDTTALQHAVQRNDLDVVNIIISSFTKDTDILEIKDLRYMIAHFKPAWRENFTWQKAHFSAGVQRLLKGGFFYGRILPGKELSFKSDKFLGPYDLTHQIDMSEHPNQVTLVAETFKFPLNFDFNTKLSHDLLAMFKNASNEFFEITEISNIIDWVFNKYMRYFMLMNSFHTLQAILCSYFIFHKEVYALKLAMRTVATLNILAELI